MKEGDKLEGKVLFCNPSVIHAACGVRDQRLYIAHPMHGSTKVASMMDQGIACAAVPNQFGQLKLHRGYGLTVFSFLQP
jgi:hypothetical protein